MYCSEKLLPGALEQNLEISLLSMILTLCLFIYQQEGGPRRKNGITETLWVERGIQGPYLNLRLFLELYPDILRFRQ